MMLYKKNNVKTNYAMALIIIAFLIISMVPVAVGESSGDGSQKEWQGENDTSNQNGPGNGSSNGTQEQERTQERTQEQDQNGTCNGTQEQERTQERTQEQDQNSTCNGTQEQERTQERTQEQNQDCSGDGSGDSEINQYQWQGEKSAQSGDGNPGNDQEGNAYQYQSQNEYRTQSESDGGNKHQWRHRYRNEIREGVENGTIIVESTLTKQDGTMIQENNHYHDGMELQLEKLERNRVRVRVSAEFHEGKVIALNVADEVLEFQDLEDLQVSFDGEPVEIGTIGEIIKAEGAEAKYIGALDKNGAQILFYIPHFSEHTIEIVSLLEETSEELFSSTNYLVLAMGIIISIALAGHIYTIGKGRK
jgi:hypothetical protein